MNMGSQNLWVYNARNRHSFPVARRQCTKSVHQFGILLPRCQFSGHLSRFHTELIDLHKRTDLNISHKCSNAMDRP